MFKNTLAALAIIAISATALSGAAEAGGKRHFKFHKHNFHHHHIGGGCYYYKKKSLFYKHRGQFRAAKHWWKKYKLCKLRRSFY